MRYLRFTAKLLWAFPIGPALGIVAAPFALLGIVLLYIAASVVELWEESQ